MAHALCELPGSGEWFRGGIVAYRREIKFDLLHVTPGPVVTERAACQMATGVAALMQADVAVAVTGAAGPDPHDGAQPGTVIIAVADRDRITSHEFHVGGSPAVVRERAAGLALRELERALLPAHDGVPRSM